MPTHYILTPSLRVKNLNEKVYKILTLTNSTVGDLRARIKIDNHMIIKIGLDWIFFSRKAA